MASTVLLDLLGGVSLLLWGLHMVHSGFVRAFGSDQSMTALMTDDRKLVAELSRMDNIVDRLDEAIKLYVTRITREVLRDLKRIHSHICSAAYPVLEAAGELEPSRLRPAEAALPNLLSPNGGAAPEPGS